MREATKKVIRYLKEVKKQKQLTCQAIVDACEAQGVSISLSTVSRIFSPNSEDGPDYRQYTINGIFNAIIGTDESEVTTGEEASAENAALKAVVEMKDATIADLQQQIEILTQEKAALEQTISTLQIRLETTTEIIQLAMESLGKGTAH